VNRRDYCLHLNAGLDSSCVQVNVGDDGGIILEFTSDDQDNHILTFRSDLDIKGLIELLRWSRKASLEAQGYKVVM